MTTKRLGAHALRLVIALALFLGVGLCACRAAAAPVFVETRVEGVINPIKVRLVQRAIERARLEQAKLLLVTLDTPGGLVSSMQEIVAALQNAGIPVVTYVAPRSAQATSAGAFILLAGDVAAMVPGTRVGAAHPVAQGQNLEGAMNEKATNSLAALIKSLATRRGRPPELAEDMVRKSVSFTAEEALDKKLVEILAPSSGELLRRLDGRAIEGKGTLRTKGLARVPVEVSTFDRILDRIADPTLTSLFISIGVLAILYELSSPGVGAGGALGALFLVLGLLGSSVLPIEASALALLAIGLVAIALEAHLPTHGILAGVGIIALVIAGMLLVDPDEYFGGMRGVRLSLFLPLVIATVLTLLFVGRATRRALGAPPQTGAEALIGKRGSARSTFGTEGPEPSGQVFVDGARWQAITEDTEIHPGDAIEVMRVTEKPTRLVVKKTS